MEPNKNSTYLAPMKQNEFEPNNHESEKFNPSPSRNNQITQ